MFKRILIVLVSFAIIFAANFNVFNPITFQDALTEAQGNGENNTINVGFGIYNISSTLTYIGESNHSLEITSGVAILDGGNSVQIANFRSMFPLGNITIDGLVMQSGRSATSGGGMFVETDFANIYITDCMFTGCYAGQMAGGLNAITNNGAILITETDFLENVAEQNAGGLNAGCSAGFIALRDCSFFADSVKVLIDPESHEGGDGGGCLLYADGGNIEMTGNTFNDCYSPDDGAAGFAYLLGSGVELVATDNVCADNVCVLNGSGLFLRINDSGSMEIRNNVLTDNTCETADGGGIFAFLNTGDMDFVGNMMVGNSVGGYGIGGGAWLWLGTGTLTADSNSFHSNTSENNGGGLAAMVDDGTLDINRNIFDSNSATEVGAGLNIAVGSTDVFAVNNSFYDNGSQCVYVYSEEPDVTCEYRNNIHDLEDSPIIDFSGSVSVVPEYCLFQGGTGEPYMTATCIDADPLWVNAPDSDFNLGWASWPTLDGTMSPCIDTADPSSPLDPDGTPCDMGAIYFDQTTGAIHNENPITPQLSIVCHPNPFNSALHIQAPDNIQLAVFDMTGKKIKDLGTSRTWQPSKNLGSGMYFIRASDGGFSKGVLYVK